MLGPPVTCVLDSEGICLPVTALQCVQLNGTLLVLAGQGPHFQIYDQHGQKLLSRRVFDAEPVHGIKAGADPDVQSKTHSITVVLWGGTLVRSGSLTPLDKNDGNELMELDLSLSGELTSPDWVLDVELLPSSILLLTAHNVLVEVPTTAESHLKSLRHDSLPFLKGPGAFLYSGNLCVANAELIIVASGTVFGEILVWTCSKKSNEHEWTPIVRHVFHGHRGSVFGVAISQRIDLEGHYVRLLASCSDDRTIGLWDISDCDELVQPPSSSIALIETGFGKPTRAEQSQLASAWGHQSRVWGVEFVSQETTEGHSRVLLSSRVRHLQTDADCLTSSLTVSMPFKVVTGSSHSLKHYLILNQHECLATTDLGELFHLRLDRGRLEFDRIYKSPAKGSLMLCYAEEQGIIFLAQQVGGLSALLPDGKTIIPIPLTLGCGISWTHVASEVARGVSSPTICLVTVLADKQCIILWLTLDNMTFRVKQTTLQLPSTFIITACRYNSTEEVLLLGSRAGALAVYDQLTHEVVISREPCCLRHLHGTDVVTSITSLNRSLETTANSQKPMMSFLTTGRDGTYAMHDLTWANFPGGRTPQITTIHTSSPPFGPNIEGAYFAPSDPTLPTGPLDLLLYGFRSTSFVVWNETQQSTVLSVECGGAHRTWSFQDSRVSIHKTLDIGQLNGGAKNFVWTKTGRINWHSAQGPSHSVIQKGGHGREIKTIARCPSNFNGNIVATGAEDTTIQLFSLKTFEKSRNRLNDTGPVGQGDNTTFQRIATLRRHTTGLRYLLFSASGDFLFSSAGCEEFYAWKLTRDAPIITIGVVLWDIMPTTEEDSDARIMSFDLFEIPGVRMNRPHEGHAGGEGIPEEHSPVSYILGLAYSNGKTRIVRYNPSTVKGQGSFETLRDLVYGSFCVMQAFFLPPRMFNRQPMDIQLDVLSAGTNGFLNLSSAAVAVVTDGSKADGAVSVPLQVHKSHQSSILSMDIICLGPQTYFVATGGDDNALGLTLVSSGASSTATPGLESSSNKAVSPLSEQHGCSGPSGDRRASSISDEQHRNKTGARRFRTIIIPRAHAAAVTALKLKQLARTSSRVSIAVITAGNDQRVRVWIVHVDIDEDNPVSAVPNPGTAHNSNNVHTTGVNWDDPTCQAIQVQRAASSWTAVADVSGLEVVAEEGLTRDRPAFGGTDGPPRISETDRSNSTAVRDPAITTGEDVSGSSPAYGATAEGKRTTCSYKILVVGVGMEVLSVKWNTTVAKEA
ncbi:hypothetical protein A1O1_00916 [Capronia coronata CBS 617.96]|uniref:Uncharacterized protein n=1 Tax=Capronia coronata CBS 617.96 TaxID=1182541 RepID=W9YSA9_9EURO|nr:uncharacterized protein A1O1_00916 [Capronia coronata CBS 617.96]EXJ95792.1 hypothetical protein A1O1_00916 [Capronia coronata CBS 617.96]